MHVNRFLKVLSPVLFATVLACASHENEEPGPTAPPPEPNTEETSRPQADATEPMSPETLAGSSWALVAWNADEPVGEEPEVTVSFEPDHIAGTSGCNRYTAGVTPCDEPGTVTIGPIAATKRMCAPEAMNVEQRFSSLLGGVTSLGLSGDNLVMTATVHGEPVSMSFERRD